MNTDNFTIDSSEIELAQNICKMINDGDVRNRAVANAIAANIATKYFDSDNYEVDKDSGLHNIGMVLQDLDISDIYINNYYIDVRVFFNDEILIPAEHVDNKLMPVAYMFIKITPDLSGASVVGFKNPENIKTESLVDGYYKLEEAELESFYDIEPLLGLYSDEQVEVDDKDIFSYIDNTLDDKNAFYAALLKSKDARIKLAKAIKAQTIFSYISINKDSIESVGFNEDKSTELDFLSEFNDIEPQDLILSELSENFSNLEESNQSVTDDSIKELDKLNTEGNDSNYEEMYSDTEELTEADLELNLEPELTTENFNENVSAEELEPPAEDSSTILSEETKESAHEHFDYTTVTSPSTPIEDLLDEDISEQEAFAEELDKSKQNPDEQIETLFSKSEVVSEADAENSPGLKVYAKNRSNKSNAAKVLLILTFLIIAGAIGYGGYTKFLSASSSDDGINSLPPEPQSAAKEVEEAMPIESVENNTDSEDLNEAISTSIPAIEQNLDASILVTNLRVDWEVPAGYASNTSAKRYLVKLGKIIQLNLKTELLLLNKPPITNKIGVELKYNSNSKKFEATGITISSGEKSVDDLILQTVNKALTMNLSTNTDSFAKLQGNPVLIIHL